MPTERTRTDDLGLSQGEAGGEPDGRSLVVTVTSFGYKEGPPPPANMVFDVRFLKNPFWVPELRVLTGLDGPVREYVMGQGAAGEFVDLVLDLLTRVLPRFEDNDISEFTIALGCTGGQHRSTALVEVLAARLQEIFPAYSVRRRHRELGEERQ